MQDGGIVTEEAKDIAGDIVGAQNGAGGGAKAGRMALLLERVEALEKEVAEARSAADGAEVRRRIEVALLEAGAVDVETAALLVERAIAGQEAPDVEAAVADLRAGKAWLFQAPPSLGALHALGDTGGDEAALTAEAAARGDRRALLRYLRLRRGG